MLLFHKVRVALSIFLALLFLTSCGVRKKTFSYESPSIKPSTTSNKGGHATTKTNLTAYYANMLGVETSELNRDLYTFIDAWMGSPHRLGGMTKDGIDCSGFVNLVFREIYHKDLPRTSQDMAQIVKRKYDHQLREGDLVFFSFGGRDIDHVGIYLHNDRFVHVSTKQGVVISNLKETWYYKYLNRCGTPKI